MSKSPEEMKELRKVVMETLRRKIVIRSGDLPELLGESRKICGDIMRQLMRSRGVVKGFFQRANCYWLNSQEKEIYIKEVRYQAQKGRCGPRGEYVRDCDISMEMVFLNKRRPKGVNTIFDECRENSQIHRVNLLIQQAKKIPSLEGMAQVKQK